MCWHNQSTNQPTNHFFKQASKAIHELHQASQPVNHQPYINDQRITSPRQPASQPSVSQSVSHSVSQPINEPSNQPSNQAKFARKEATSQPAPAWHESLPQAPERTRLDPGIGRRPFNSWPTQFLWTWATQKVLAHFCCSICGQSAAHGPYQLSPGLLRCSAALSSGDSAWGVGWKFQTMFQGSSIVYVSLSASFV